MACPIDVILRNTTPITRWRFSQCSSWLYLTAARISEELNAAIVVDRTPHPWSYIMQSIILYSDTPRRELVREAYKTRTNVSSVAVWDYHLMRICGEVPTFGYVMCVHGDIDVIRYAIGCYKWDPPVDETSGFTIYARIGALICRWATDPQFVDAACMLLSRMNDEYVLKHQHDPPPLLFLVPLFATLMCVSDATMQDNLINRIIALMPVHRRESQRTQPGSLLAHARFMVACQRGDTAIVMADRNKWFASSWWCLAAAACGNNAAIIKHLFGLTDYAVADYAQHFIPMYRHMTLDTLKLLVPKMAQATILYLTTFPHIIPAAHIEYLQQYA